MPRTIHAGQCPRCRQTLAGVPHQGVVPLVCPSCHGLYLAGKHLAQHFGPALEALVAGKAVWGPEAEDIACPIGCGAMQARRIQGRIRSAIVDVCPSCTGVWFDGGEVQAVFEAARLEKKAHLPRLDPEEAARKELDLIAQRQQTNDEIEGGMGTWLVQFVTGLPLEGYNPVHRFPLMTWAVIAACCALFFLEIKFGWDYVVRLSLVPAIVLEGNQLVSRFVGSMFLHSGWGHLLGNMYFLKIFGDNVEDRLGRWRFLAVYFTCGMVGGLAQVASTPTSEIPIMGASGAIGGVLAAYAVLFPDAQIQIAPSAITFLQRFRVRALFYFPFWFFWQFVCVLVFEIQGVAWWDHIGGFSAGFLAAVLFRPEDPRIAAIAARHAREAVPNK